MLHQTLLTFQFRIAEGVGLDGFQELVDVVVSSEHSSRRLQESRGHVFTYIPAP